MADSLRPLALLELSDQFLRLVEAAADEMVSQGNRLTTVAPAYLSNEELLGKFAEETRWSDFHLGVPILFNFYHGIELLLKGFILARGASNRTHQMTELFNQFCDLFPDSQILGLLAPHIQPIDPGSVFGQFLSQNAISIDDYYQALKYPFSRNGAEFSHIRLKYNTERGVEYFETLAECVREVRPKAVALSRNLGLAS